VKFQEILSSFELVMKYGRSGQSTVETRFSEVNETLRLVVQMVISGHNVVYMCFTVPDL